MNEEKTKVYDFTRLDVEVEFGRHEAMDFSKEVANEIHVGTADIGVDDIARKIYYEGKAEIPDPKVRQEIVAIIMLSKKIVPIKNAVKELLKD